VHVIENHLHKRGCVNRDKCASQWLRELIGPLQQSLTLLRQVEGATDAPIGRRRFRWRPFPVRPGQYRAVDIVQYLGSNRTQQELPKGTVPTIGDQDQVNSLVLHKLHNFLSGVALQKDLLRGSICYTRCEFVQFAAATCVEIFSRDHLPVFLIKNLHFGPFVGKAVDDVSEDQLGVEARRQKDRPPGCGARALRKVDGNKNLF